MSYHILHVFQHGALLGKERGHMDWTGRHSDFETGRFGGDLEEFQPTMRE